MVTTNVLTFSLVVGNPAKQLGWVGEYGHRIEFDASGLATCIESKQVYKLENNLVNRIK